VIAEKFEALVTVTALARGLLQRGNVGEGSGQQGGIGEFVPDPRLKGRGGSPGGGGLAGLFLRCHRLAAGVRPTVYFAR
jgi:hypothetical protein